MTLGMYLCVAEAPLYNARARPVGDASHPTCTQRCARVTALRARKRCAPTDRRPTDLLAAIQAHQSGSASTGDASEANGVIQLFNALPEPQKQDLLNFLRSL